MRGSGSGTCKAAEILLEAAIRQKTAKIGVIGLGYVGLPLIRTFVAAGFQTLGFDVDAEKVKSLQAGRSYIEHIPSEWIASYVSERKVCAHGRHERMAEADALLICVPTPLSREPRSGLDLRGGDGPRDCRPFAARSTGGVGEHDVSRHDARRGVADFGEDGT